MADHSVGEILWLLPQFSSLK